MTRARRGVGVVALTVLAGGCQQHSQVLDPKPQATPVITGAPEAPVRPAYTQYHAPESYDRPGQAPSWIADAASDALSRPLPRDASAAYSGGDMAYGARPMMLGVTDDGLESLAQVTAGEVGADFDPAVSRDGAFMVFASTRHRATADLYLQHTGGSAITQLTSDAGNEVMPAISPDGTRIAFASDRAGAWNIYVMSAQGGQAVQVTRERTADLHPSWSPDGQRLVFSRLGARSGQWEMWVVDVRKPQTPEFIGYGLMPEWCPVAATGEGGADQIAFQRGRQRGDRAYSIWTLSYRPGGATSPTEIVPAGELAAINPAWSPDGRFIAFACAPVSQPLPGRRALRPMSADVWITSADGSQRATVTSGRSCNLSPVWANAERLYFVSDRSGAEAVWSINTTQAMAMMSGRPAVHTASTRANVGTPTVAPAPATAPAPQPMQPAAPSTDVPTITTAAPTGGEPTTATPGTSPAETVVTAPEPADPR